MTVHLLLRCGGCDAEVTTEPWRQHYKSVFGGPLCVVTRDDAEELIPEGWVAWDPYTHCTYCPACWASIDGPHPACAECGEPSDEPTCDRCAPHVAEATAPMTNPRQLNVEPTRGVRMNRIAWACVALILSAIVAANLISSHYGPSASIYNAFFLIGVVLSTKDYLYDVWGEHRIRNMSLLIATGAVLSYGAAFWFAGAHVPHEVVRKIAVGSFAAYAVAESWDTIIYARLRRLPWLERSNASNLVGAALDSGVFVLIAFGWSWPIVFGQFCAKVAGGFVWSLVLQHTGERSIEATA